MPPDKDDTYIELLRKRVITQLATKPLPPHLQRYVSLPSQKQAPAAEDDRGIKFPNLDEDPEAQQALAYFAQYTPTKWLLEEEARLIADRRDLHAPERKTPRFDRKSNEDIYDWARKHRLTGLCFSGGGIRSATFNLGILQG